MIIVETMAKIRRLYYVQNKGIKTIARELHLSKNTVKKVIREDKTSKVYARSNQTLPIMDEFKDRLTSMLETNIKQPLRLRYTAKRLYQLLCKDGFKGSYSTINRFTIDWRHNNHTDGRKVLYRQNLLQEKHSSLNGVTRRLKCWGCLQGLK